MNILGQLIEKAVRQGKKDIHIVPESSMPKKKKRKSKARRKISRKSRKANRR